MIPNNAVFIDPDYRKLPPRNPDGTFKPSCERCQREIKDTGKAIRVTVLDAYDIIKILETQQATISDQAATIHLFASYIEMAADKGALDQKCHAVIKAKEVLNYRK